MSTEDDKWNLDRLPTKWERIYGSIFSALIFVLMAVFLYASTIPLLSSEGATTNVLVSFVVSLLLFSGSGYLLLRVAFGKRSKPSPRAIIISGYVIGVASGILLAVSLFGLGNTPYLAGVGLTGLAGSSLIINQGKRRGNS